jgi:hypothetical protein
MIRRIAALGVAVACAITFPATSAWASCAADPNVTFLDRMDRAVAVFVGTVTTTSGRVLARVKVLEVWRGGDLAGERRLPSEVTVNGSVSHEIDSSADPSAGSSVDRHFAVGQTLLFLPESGGRTGDEVTFDDNACSGTTEFSAEVAKYRPPGVRPIASVDPIAVRTHPGARDAGPSWIPWALVLGLGGIAGAYGVLRRVVGLRRGSPAA